MKKKTIVLAILDGYGFKEDYAGNAIEHANTPFFNYIYQNYPWTKINASEGWVGLPDGQMGNSEVGHLNIGAGRIVDQPLVKITKEVNSNTLKDRVVIKEAIKYAKENQKQVHIMGLLSDGGVHSHILHIKAMLKIFTDANLKPYLHAFMDGRDTKPDIGETFIEEMKEFNIATIAGRYYAMDRDKNFDRLQKALDIMVDNKGDSFTCAYDYVLSQKNNGNTDEFIMPAYNSNLNVKIQEGDVMIMVNFRPDRANQITASFAGIDYEFKPNVPKNIYYVSSTKLADYTNTKIIFPLEKLTNTLGDWLSKKGYTQLRIAETEKYAHVTFFLDGGIDKSIKGADRILIDSPSVATYDLQPEMSLPEVTKALVKEIKTSKYDIVILNYANPDMVGHTGNYEATIKAVEHVDQGLKDIYDSLKEVDGTLMITADHGNAEEMIDEQGKPKTSHSANLIPFIVTDKSVKLAQDGTTALSGVAPAILNYISEEIPPEMNGESIIKK